MKAAAALAAIAVCAGWQPAAAERLSRIESCVSSAAIELEPDDAQALLDAGDLVRVGTEMVARYPMLLRDGFAPSQILLWQREGKTVYVTLLQNPEKPQEMCFTASFAGQAFEFTPLLLSKYFFISDLQA